MSGGNDASPKEAGQVNEKVVFVNTATAAVTHNTKEGSKGSSESISVHEDLDPRTRKVGGPLDVLSYENSEKITENGCEITSASNKKDN